MPETHSNLHILLNYPSHNPCMEESSEITNFCLLVFILRQDIEKKNDEFFTRER